MADAGPFDVLQQLAGRAHGADMSLPAAENAQTHWNGLGFNLLGQRFVAPMSEVAEMMRIPAATRLPKVKPFVQGIAAVRGRLMALIDLALFFGEQEKGKSHRTVFAVEGPEQYFGFMIDESLGMQHFPQENFQNNVPVAEKFAPYIDGGYEVAGTYWPVLSLGRLARDTSLQTLASDSSKR